MTPKINPENRAIFSITQNSQKDSRQTHGLAMKVFLIIEGEQL